MTDRPSSPSPAFPDLEFRWRRGLPTGAAADLRGAAVADDAEMGHSASLSGAVWQSDSVRTASIYTRFRRRGVPPTAAGRLAAVLTVGSLGGGAGVGDLVVAPEFRSIGVATSVVEELVSETADADTDDRVMMCAYGSHPAAARLAARFGAELVGERIHVLLPSRAALDTSRAARTPASSVSSTPSEQRESDGVRNAWAPFDDPARDRTYLEISDNTGSIGSASVSRTGDVGDILEVQAPEGNPLPADVLAPIVCHAARHLLDGGAHSVRAAVYSDSGPEFDAFRAAAFQRDRTDLLFIGAPKTVRGQLRPHRQPV